MLVPLDSWFYTLTERKDFEEIWLVQNGAVQSFVQDSVRGRLPLAPLPAADRCSAAAEMLRLLECDHQWPSHSGDGLLREHHQRHRRHPLRRTNHGLRRVVLPSSDCPGSVLTSVFSQLPPQQHIHQRSPTFHRSSRVATTTLTRTSHQIYGFTAVQGSLFLTTCCLIISRREEVRFRIIDAKTGGGFV